MTRWSHADLAMVQARLGVAGVAGAAGAVAQASQPEKRPKYGNRKTVVDGQVFDSKLEANLYRALKLRAQPDGDVLWFTFQVPFRLEGGVVYRADFLAVTKTGVEVWDAKGKDTQASINKRKQVKARYGVDVLLWRRAA